MSSSSLEQLVRGFADAWNRHDVEALLSMMTEDAVFDAARGPEPWGARHIGKGELRKAFSAVWDAFPDASWDDPTHVVIGDRGFSEWTFRGTSADGNRVEVRGVDIFTFDNGLISKKDTFRKA